jgi:hypothetical protein
MDSDNDVDMQDITQTTAYPGYNNFANSTTLPNHFGPEAKQEDVELPEAKGGGQQYINDDKAYAQVSSLSH